MQLELTGDHSFRPATIEKYEKAKRLLEEGKTLAIACEKAHISKITFRDVKMLDKNPFIHQRGASAQSKKRKYTKRAKFIDVPMIEESPKEEKVFVIVTHSAGLRSVLENLK